MKQNDQVKTRKTSINQIRAKFTHIEPKNKQQGWRHNLQKNNPEQLRQFRIDDYQMYCSLKRNIAHTFSNPGDKIERDLLILNKNLNDNQVNKVKKLIDKLSIKTKSKQIPFEKDDINTEFISKMYIMEKSKQKRRQLMLSSRKIKSKKQQQSFFGYSVDHIKEFQKSYSASKQQKSMPFKIYKKRNNSIETNFKRIDETIKVNKNNNKTKTKIISGLQLQRYKSQRQRHCQHPIVKIFDNQSFKLLKDFKQTKQVDLIMTQPYLSYEQRIDPKQNSILLTGINLTRIQKHFEKVKSQRIKSTLQQIRD